MIIRRPLESERMMGRPDFNVWRSASVSVTPVVFSSIASLKVIASTELKSGEAGVGLACSVPGTGPANVTAFSWSSSSELASRFGKSYGSFTEFAV